MPSPALSRRQWLSTLAAASLIPTTSPSRARAAEAESFLPQRHPLLITNNPVIAAARDAGLAVLQPSQADLQHHIRAKPDEVLQAICDTGGLFGICWIAPFLQGTGDLAALLDHNDYAVRTFGGEHVAIGTDVAHLSQHNAAAAKQIPPRP
ncbi:MAG: membrane dipeptidase, partial [Planctomycetaceae bacterium]